MWILLVVVVVLVAGIVVRDEIKWRRNVTRLRREFEESVARRYHR